MAASNVSNESLEAVAPLEIADRELIGVAVAMYSLAAILSFVGNSTVIVVLLLGKRSSRGIRSFLLSLAVSDVTMALFCIPFTYTSYVFGRWLFLPNFCPVVLFMQHVAVTVSVYTLMAIGIDRFYAIIYPLKPRWTKSKGLLVILSIWGVAASLASVQFVYGRGEWFSYSNVEYFYCNEMFPPELVKFYTIFIFVFTFAFPLTVIAFTYTCIGWKMWRHTSPGNANAERDLKQFRSKRKVVKMLAVIVVLFALCWFPQHTYLLLYTFRYDLFSRLETNHNHVLFITCHWISMANSFVNPIIYSFMSENFLDDLKDIFLRCSRLIKFGPSRPLPRSRCLGSYRSTTYILSFRNLSGVSHEHARRSEDTTLEKSLDDSFKFISIDDQDRRGVDSAAV